jgi:hypothetical protein
MLNAIANDLSDRFFFWVAKIKSRYIALAIDIPMFFGVAKLKSQKRGEHAYT